MCILLTPVVMVCLIIYFGKVSFIFLILPYLYSSILLYRPYTLLLYATLLSPIFSLYLYL